jgi:membrane protein implicated in regulation of membrane protease activity
MGTKYNKIITANGTLLVLLLICIAGVFFSFHNMVSTPGQGTYLYPILFSIFSTAIAIFMYWVNTRSNEKLLQTTEQFDHLRRMLEQTRNEKNQKVKEIEVEEKKVNIDEELKKIIPTETIESKEAFTEKILQNASKSFDIAQGVFYLKDEESGIFSFVSGYAHFSEAPTPTFAEGDTLPGQVAKNKAPLLLDSVPEGYITVMSGLGRSNPTNLLIVPVVNQKGSCIGIIEVASFKPFGQQAVQLFTRLGNEVGAKLHFNDNTSQE